MRNVLDCIWGALQIAAHVALGPVLRGWRTSWGTRDDEIWLSLPGDEIVPVPTWSYTRALTILAPRSAVWPWLLQIGQSRGGFYSYEALENLVGCDVHNVTEIRPELQTLRVGDVVRMHRSGFGPAVSAIEPERALVLGGPPDKNGSQATWGFHLIDGPRGTTRLLERGRNAVGKGLAAKLGYGPALMEPISFVMSKKMLSTIKQLAEAAPIATFEVRPSFSSAVLLSLLAVPRVTPLRGHLENNRTKTFDLAR
jgi:hypothetical protein